MQRFLLIGILVMANVIAGYSQSSNVQSTLSGVVVDQTGAAIAGARVDLNVGGVKKQSTITDKFGNFRFTHLIAASYQILVTNEGFEPTSNDVTIAPALSTPLIPIRISMSIANLHTEVTVANDSAQISTEATDNKDSIALTRTNP